MKNLPNSWHLVDLKDITKNIKHSIVDGPFGTQLKVHEFVEQGIPLIEMQNIKGDRFTNVFRRFITKKKLEDIKRSTVYPGDLIISKTGSLGYVAIAPNSFEKAIITSRLAKISINWNIINSKYIKYFFIFIRNNGFWEKIAKGTTMKILNIKHLANTKIPLPPLNEQNRIVEKIEELFSDLDIATEDLKKIQEQLKIYRQVVLKSAFEGKLTKEWRQTRKEASNIEHTTLNDICIKAEKIKNEENSERKIKYLDIGSIDNKVFKIVSHKTYQIKDAPSRAKQIVKESDTLFSTVRTYLKNIAYVHSEYDNEICSTGFCVIRPKKDVLLSKYIFYYVISDDFVNRVSPLQTGTSYPAVRDDDILKQEIPLVTIDEQEQIVQEIEIRLSVCDKLEETIEQSLKKMEYLRQSILKKAFEGKLVSQDPNDLSACELLKQIKIKKDKMNKNGK